MQSQPTSSTAPGQVAAIILAAGRSTRMRSHVPKPLHSVCGLPLTRHVIEACRACGIQRIVVVIGHEAEMVREGLGNDVEYAIQPEPNGTGGAVRAAIPALGDFTGAVLTLAGDVPLLTSHTISLLLAEHSSLAAGGTVATAISADAGAYGRIVRDSAQAVTRIVEYRDASESERSITEWNASIYCFDMDVLRLCLPRLTTHNAQGELYLTDVIEMAACDGKTIASVALNDSIEALGVNTRVELAQTGAIMRARIVTQHMLAGVTVIDPATTYVDTAVTIGMDSTLLPNTHLVGRTEVGEDCTIGPGAYICNSTIGNACTVVFSQVTGCRIGNRVRIGPFAHLRPGCDLADGVKIGDFVELKKTRMGENVSAGHLAYLGDADIGSGTNIGAGVITCNFDGVTKHPTTIGERAFIGSNSTLVAPIDVGAGAYVAAASAITENVPADSLSIARSRQTNKIGWAADRRNKAKGIPRE